MWLHIRETLRPALVLLALFTLLTGLAYPLALTGAAQVLFPSQASGSLVTRGGRVVGSALIAQGFASDRYFQPRASAAGKGYDASASAATNLAPGSAALRDALAERIAAARAQGTTSDVPPDLVTTSASGLDPDLSPEAAFSQVDRVARARGIEPAKLRGLVEAATTRPLIGFLGDPVVNVLKLNIQLDKLPQDTPPP